MTTLIVHAKTGAELKTAIDALAATTIHIVTKLHSKPEYLVIYTP